MSSLTWYYLNFVSWVCIIWILPLECILRSMNYFASIPLILFQAKYYVVCIHHVKLDCLTYLFCMITVFISLELFILFINLEYVCKWRYLSYYLCIFYILANYYCPLLGLINDQWSSTCSYQNLASMCKAWSSSHTIIYQVTCSSDSSMDIGNHTWLYVNE